MKVISIVNYQTNENCYILINENTKEAVVIDPGCEADRILDTVKDEQATITHILITHCHYDHIFGLQDLRDRTNAIFVCTKEADLSAQDPKINLSIRFPEPIVPKPADLHLSDGEIIDVGGMSMKCITTSGHTSDSTCFLFGNQLFTGDTLFLREVGRWDLPTGNEQELRNSIGNKLYKLDDETIVYPGHGESTSIGYEKKYNFYVKQ